MGNRWVILIDKIQAYILLQHYRRKFPEVVAWIESGLQKQKEQPQEEVNRDE